MLEVLVPIRVRRPMARGDRRRRGGSPGTRWAKPVTDSLGRLGDQEGPAVQRDPRGVPVGGGVACLPEWAGQVGGAGGVEADGLVVGVEGTDEGKGDLVSGGF